MSISSRLDAKTDPDSIGKSIFGRILVGIDGTRASDEACRQIARLADPDAAIDAAAVVHLGPTVAEALDAAHIADVLEREAEEALARAREILGAHAETRELNGFVTAALLDEAARFDATLIALGSHGHRRAAEIVLGGVAGEVLHSAPCSVLLARPRPVDVFPRTIVVGHDGSAHADRALAAAQHIRARIGGTLRVITALRGKDVDLEHVLLHTPFADDLDQHPVSALVEATCDADLLVVGSRGLHGIKALGSVSERVAHQAACSVLVVRAGPQC